MDKIADIFIGHREHTNYKLAIQQRYNRIITTLGDSFKQSDLTEKESLLANIIQQVLQYNSNKYAGVILFNSHLVCKIKRKATDKLYKKSCLVV